MAVWLLNLDAEIELGHSGSYQPNLRTLRTLQELEGRAREVLHDGAIGLGHGDRAELERRSAELGEAGTSGLLGYAWSPTRAAQTQLEKWGIRVAPAPSHEVLVRVNHRRFAFGLGTVHDASRLLDSESDLEHWLSKRNPSDVWLAKRSFGFAGRGQRRLTGRLSSDDARWLTDSVRLHDLVMEPFVEILVELSKPGFLDKDGTCTLGVTCRQTVDERRAWKTTEPLAEGEFDAEYEQALSSRVEGVADALHRAGYFGPFGVDAYLFSAPMDARFSIR
jgi:hypothetical protein